MSDVLNSHSLKLEEMNTDNLTRKTSHIGKLLKNRFQGNLCASGKYLNFYQAILNLDLNFFRHSLGK